MTLVTDPARELAEIAERLTRSTKAVGEKFLADQFGVSAWSTDFVKIITCILERADLVTEIVRTSDMDDDHKANALNDLRQFKTGFTGNSLRQPWNNAGNGLTAMKDHGRPIQYLSTIVRQKVCYPKLTDDEVSELLGLIDAYVEELGANGDAPEFVKQAILDGLAMFRFQLDRVGWMGSGYALAAFREVMLACEFASRQFRDADEFDGEAALRGLRTIVSKFREKVDAARGWTESAEAVWKWYQVGSSVAAPLLLAGRVHGAT